MSAETVWLAFALILVIEGVFPLVATAVWRRTFSQLLQFSNGQVRFMAVGSILTGLLMIWFLVV